MFSSILHENLTKSQVLRTIPDQKLRALLASTPKKFLMIIQLNFLFGHYRPAAVQ